MIRTELMPHQDLIVQFCSDKDYVGIFSDYGTGKSLAALAITEKKKYKKVLIVSTRLSIDTTWCDEIRTHSNFRFCILKGTAKQKANLLAYALGKVENPNRYSHAAESSRPMLFLINYEGIKSIYGELCQAGFDAIFADESTKIKTHDAERTMALYEVGEYARHRYAMTGFPITEKLAELYSQVKFLDRGGVFGNSYYAFLNRYFVRFGPKLVVRRNSIAKILKLIKPFCIRITNETLKLPPAVYKPIQIEPTAEQVALLTQFNESFKLEFGKVKIDTKYIFTLLAKSLEVCDGFVKQTIKDEDGKVLEEHVEFIETAKDEALIETLEEIDVSRNKVVIWCAFILSVSKIAKILKKLKIPVLVLTGDPNIDANKTVAMFQNSSHYNVLIATQKKAAESVTLTSARYAIYYSNIWSNDARLNSEARVRRKGSEKHDSIIYIDLVTRGTVEFKVYTALRTKKNLIGELKTEFNVMKIGAA